MSRRQSKNGRAGFVPVILSAIVLVAFGAYGLGVTRAPVDEKYLAKVAAQIDAIPYRIGSLVGTDIPPTPAAVKLLKPNRIFERNYVEPHSMASASMLIVHCSEVRDMYGHYPPICYPAHGWVTELATTETVTLAGKPRKIGKYQFSNSGNGTERRMTVMVFFVVPSDETPILADMDALMRVSRSESGGGVAQIQVVTFQNTDREAPALSTEPLFEAIEPTIDTILRGSSNE